MVSTHHASTPARQRRRLTVIYARCSLAVSGLLFATLTAMQPASLCRAQERPPETPVREIFVPFDAI